MDNLSIPSVVNLATVPPSTAPRWLLEPLIESSPQCTILFADGGIGKSLFGLHLCVSLTTGIEVCGFKPQAQCACLVADWEADEDTHAERLRAIAKGLGIPVPDVYYLKLVGPLREELPAVKAAIAEYGIGFVMLDSLGMARGGEAESADTARDLFSAMRELNVPCLGIDHITKAAANNGGADKPFGSVYTHNLARRTYSMTKTRGIDDSMEVALTNKKANNGSAVMDHKILVTFTQNPETGRLDAVTFESQTGFSTGPSEPRAIDRIMRCLREHGALTPAEIADITGIKVASVRSRCHEVLDVWVTKEPNGAWRLLHTN